MPRHTTTILAAALALAAAPTTALAQSSINAAAKFTWSENCGWLNWRDAQSGAAGVRLHPTYLSGRIWAENVGWITVGDGSPADGVAYANTTGADHGVNVAPDGLLTGLAWGENIGWINFGPVASLAESDQARYDAATKRFAGNLWGENIGWISLSSTIFVLATCPADINASGEVSVQDIFDFLTAWLSLDPIADFNASGQITVPDLFDFLAAQRMKRPRVPNPAPVEAGDPSRRSPRAGNANLDEGWGPTATAAPTPSPPTRPYLNLPPSRPRRLPASRAPLPPRPYWTPPTPRRILSDRPRA